MPSDHAESHAISKRSSPLHRSPVSRHDIFLTPLWARALFLTPPAGSSDPNPRARLMEVGALLAEQVSEACYRRDIARFTRPRCEVAFQQHYGGGPDPSSLKAPRWAAVLAGGAIALQNMCAYGKLGNGALYCTGYVLQMPPCCSWYCNACHHRSHSLVWPYESSGPPSDPSSETYVAELRKPPGGAAGLGHTG